MSTRAVIVSLILAIVLGGAAYLFLAPPAAVTRAERSIIPLEPSRIARIDFDLPGKPRWRAVQGEAGIWELVTLVDGVEARRWPLSREPIQGALRLLATLEGDPDPEVSVPEDSPRLTVHDHEGRAWTLRVGREQLGGWRALESTPPEADARTWRTEVSLLDALVETGPGLWREPVILAEMGDPDRITLRSGDRGVTLVQRGAAWRVAEADAPADAEAVAALLRSLSALRATRFLEDAPDTGFDQALAEITVEASRRGLIDGAMRTATRRVHMTVGGANLDLTEVTVRVERSREDGGEPGGPWVTSVSAPRAPLDGVASRPAHYVSKVSAISSETEIGAIEIVPVSGGAGGSFTFTKGLDGWTTRSGEPLAPEVNRALRGVLHLLHTTPAQAVEVVDPADHTPASGAAGLTYLSPGGAPIEEIEVWIEEGVMGDALAARTGQVVRRYPAGMGVAELTSLLAIAFDR